MKRTLFAAPILALCLFAAYLVAAAPGVAARKCTRPGELIAASVMVDSPASVGSGVAFANGKNRYVWTCAHVVASAQNPQGSRVEFRDVWLVRPVLEDGRKVGEERTLARVIRYSKRHDVALLLSRRSCWPERAAQFACGRCVPEPGEAVWHVGSMRGARGVNSLADGIFSAAGRLRKGFEYNEEDDPVVYDQVSLNAVHPGSSGGGVFFKCDGKCIGLVSQYLGAGRTYGAALIIPARRLRAFARDEDCRWALDCSVAAPKCYGKAVRD